MFAKLLKHDFNSLSRVGKPLSIGAFILGILGLLASIGHSLIETRSYKLFELSIEALDKGDTALSDKYAKLYSLSSIGSSILSLFMVFVVFLLSVACVTIMVLIVVNFYKTLITDEGYLTFTLPVSPTKILLSKIINGIIWNTIILLLWVFGIAMIVIPSVSINDSGILHYFFTLGGFDKMDMVLFITLMIESSYFSVIAYQIFYFFAVFLGGVVAKRRKILASAGIIVGGHVIYYVFQQIASFILTAVIFAFVSGTTSDPWLSSNPVDALLVANASLLLSFLCSIVISIVFFFLTKWLMTKKVNLP